MLAPSTPSSKLSSPRPRRLDRSASFPRLRALEPNAPSSRPRSRSNRWEHLRPALAGSIRALEWRPTGAGRCYEASQRDDARTAHTPTASRRLVPDLTAARVRATTIGMTYRLAALGGDGVGPEVMAQALLVLERVSTPLGLSWDVDEIPCGGRYYLEHGADWPADGALRCERADMILLGAVGWPDPGGQGPVTMNDGKMAGYSPVLGNRTRLDLYANIRPVKLYDGVSHRIHGRHLPVWQPGKVDMVILRENTEGLYAGAGGILSPGGTAEVAVDTRIITRRASERIIARAFELCLARGRGAPEDGALRVTAILKDNVLRGCQLFRDVFYQVGERYPQIEKETAIVDAFTQWLMGRPEHYDVCVTTNMFGDIVTDLASVLQGGMGLAVGANVGDTHGMFEPIHGSAPRYTGQNQVNPIAMILALQTGLVWLEGRTGDQRLGLAGRSIEHAVIDLLRTGHPLTYDLVGPERAASCSDVGDAIATLSERHLATLRQASPLDRDA